MEELAQILESASHWYLTVDDHKSNYQTAAAWLADHFDMGRYDEQDLSTAERAECERINHVWHLQVYWDTPVGFCDYVAPTFEGMMHKLRNR